MRYFTSNSKKHLSYQLTAISQQLPANSYKLAAILLSTFLISCNNNNNQFDASGTFEADETIISAETSGTIKQFDIAEGQTLNAGTFIGYIDSVQLYLKKKQLEMQIQSVLSQKPNISTQLGGIEVQLDAAKVEQQRTR